MRVGSFVSSVPARPALAREEAVRPLASDRVCGSPGSAPLTLLEHNRAQVDLMRRMGVDDKNPRAMVAWIGEHAGRFRELFEDPQQAPWANVWRGMLRDPAQRADALDAIGRALQQH